MLTKNPVSKSKISLPFSIWCYIDLLYPPFCCGCGQIGFEICPACFKTINFLSLVQVCMVCGESKQAEKSCSICKKIEPIFNQARSWGTYSGVLKKIIHKIKYGRGFGLIEYFINPIIQFIEKWHISFDIVVPIPLGKQRHIERGYNQSALIAKPIAKDFNTSYIDDGLVRIRETRTQVGLNYQERKKNLKDAFSADQLYFKGQSILLMMISQLHFQQ